jgi:uncharacterized protein (DUF1330 family)
VFGLGDAVATQSLNAQAKPPYVPRAQAVITAAGGRFLGARQKVTAIEGEPPKSRIAVIAWDSAEQIQAWRNSAAFKELLPIRDKYGKVRAFTVEGPIEVDDRKRRSGCEAAS